MTKSIILSIVALFIIPHTSLFGQPSLVNEAYRGGLLSELLMRLNASRAHHPRRMVDMGIRHLIQHKQVLNHF